jgi:hypothetical protein
MMLNNRGERIAPSGTSDLIFLSDDICPSNCTQKERSVRYSLNHLNKAPCTPHWLNLYNRPVCLTLSNALDRSQNTATTADLAVRAARIAASSLATWSTPARCSLNPPRDGLKESLCSRKNPSPLLISDSNSLLMHHKSEMGLNDEIKVRLLEG